MRLVPNLLLVSLLLPATARAGIIRGHVRDAASGEPLASVVAALDGTDLGDISGSNGYFLIADVPPGSYEIHLTAIGYDGYKQTVLLVGDTTVTLDVRLATAPIPLKEVKVTAQKAEFKREVKVSSLTLSHSQLRTTPFVVESDLFRALQTLPGIVTTSDFSAASFVRGGNADQNLVLLDGVSIYNPTHLGGLFSVFDPDIVASADLSTGGFPAEYGGRLSSVLDVRTRDGRADRLSGDLGLSLLAAKALVEGPLPMVKAGPGKTQARGTFFLYGRRTYFDKVLELVDFPLPYYFYDLNGKATFDYGEDTRLALYGFMSTDRLDIGKGHQRVFVDWGNRLGSLSWQQYWSPRFSVKSHLTCNNYFYDIDLANGFINVRDTIQEYGLRSNAAYVLSGENEVDGGVEASYATFRFNAKMLGGYRFNITGRPLNVAGYAQGKLRPFAGLLVQPGLRLERYLVAGDSNARYVRLSPRLSFKYFLNEITAIKGAWGIYNQYVSALSPDFSPIPVLFFWLPVFGQNEPQVADHYVLGAERWLDENTNLTLEGYYKRYARIYEMSDDARPESLNTTLLKPGTGYSYGLDLLLRRDWGKLTGWLGYSLSFARVKFDSLEFAPSYDRRHTFNVVLTYALPRGYTITAHWNYGSGLPYTGTVGYYRRWNYDWNGDHIGKDWYEIPGAKHASRYPDYHRLDLGIEKSFTVGKTRLIAQLEVINVYDRQNLMFYFWDYDQKPPRRLSQTQLPILPSLGARWTF
jgi:hypothetical protein